MDWTPMVQGPKAAQGAPDSEMLTQPEPKQTGSPSRRTPQLLQDLPQAVLAIVWELLGSCDRAWPQPPVGMQAQLDSDGRAGEVIRVSCDGGKDQQALRLSCRALRRATATFLTAMNMKLSVKRPAVLHWEEELREGLLLLGRFPREAQLRSLSLVACAWEKDMMSLLLPTLMVQAATLPGLQQQGVLAAVERIKLEGWKDMGCGELYSVSDVCRQLVHLQLEDCMLVGPALRPLAVLQGLCELELRSVTIMRGSPVLQQLSTLGQLQHLVLDDLQELQPHGSGYVEDSCSYEWSAPCFKPQTTYKRSRLQLHHVREHLQGLPSLRSLALALPSDQPWKVLGELASLPCASQLTQLSWFPYGENSEMVDHQGLQVSFPWPPAWQYGSAARFMAAFRGLLRLQLGRLALESRVVELLVKGMPQLQVLWVHSLCLDKDLSRMRVAWRQLRLDGGAPLQTLLQLPLGGLQQLVVRRLRGFLASLAPDSAQAAAKLLARLWVAPPDARLQALQLGSAADLAHLAELAPLSRLQHLGSFTLELGRFELTGTHVQQLGAALPWLGRLSVHAGSATNATMANALAQGGLPGLRHLHLRGFNMSSNQISALLDLARAGAKAGAQLRIYLEPEVSYQSPPAAELLAWNAMVKDSAGGGCSVLLLLDTISGDEYDSIDCAPQRYEDDGDDAYGSDDVDDSSSSSDGGSIDSML